jgi:hypothetical protein
MANQVSKGVAPIRPLTSAAAPFKVTPGVIGNSLKPFPCPHCNVVRVEVVDAKLKSLYTSGGVTTCPNCSGKYVISTSGSGSDTHVYERT